jgi:alkylhydroperoxidase family enzyme
MTPRLEPLPVDEWDDRAREALGGSGAPRGPADTTLNIFGTLARHPDLLRRWLVFGSHVLTKSTLSARHRELLILRVGWLCRAPYEWGQHIVIARREGVTDQEIVRVAEGPHAAGWDPFEALLMRATDELHADQCIGDDTWRGLSADYDDQQLLDVIFTVGQYTLVSMALNSCGVERDDGVDEASVPFPPAR